MYIFYSSVFCDFYFYQDFNGVIFSDSCYVIQEPRL